MRTLRYSIAMLAIAVLVTGAAHSQIIQVTVDGAAVQFHGVGPQAVQGRVLVPLRGVFEYMGAFVDWVPSSRTVIAQKGNTNVQLQIGSRAAYINGSQVLLDVPAQISGGSTMVPLRFLGEALGANVRWEGATQTVAITTGGDGNQNSGGNNQSGQNAPAINSFQHNAQGWLRAGSVLEVRLEGTSGGTATFRIPGVVDVTDMRERDRGTYVGTWTVPNRTITISGASVLGQLRTTSGVQMVQAGDPISIDTTPPTITDLLPADDAMAVVARPTVSAILDDEGGSGIDPQSVKLMVDGRDVTSSTNVNSVYVTYRPAQALAAGSTDVKLTARDMAGNSVSRQWSFDIGQVTGDLVTAFTVTAPQRPSPGDVISVRMEADPRGQATFSIGNAVTNRAMTEQTSGVYEGEYTVRSGVDVSGAAVTGTFRSRNGQTVTVQSENRLGSTSGVVQKPTITSPRQDSDVSSPLVVKGTAAANSRVRVEVKYATTVLGAVRMNGVISEQTVAVDSRGRFQTQSIKLDTMIQGRDTEYTITATALNTQGEESEQTVVTVGKS